MKIIIVAGGTGGHIYPGIAIAQEIKRRDPGADILFLGGEGGLEKEIIAREGYKIELVQARGFFRILGILQAFLKLKAFSPSVVVSTGGYVSFPTVLASLALRIPFIVHEQNALPGAVNRFFAKFARRTFLSFPESLKYLQGEVVGNPVRDHIISADRETARKKRGFTSDKKVILVMGGSQGSRKINEAVVASLSRLPSNVSVMHLVGKRDWQKLGGSSAPNYFPVEYLYDISEVLAAADLAVSRAGATAIAEFLARGIPMVLVPFPFAADDHQRMNAQIISRGGAAIVIEDAEFTPERFLSAVSDSPDYVKMSKAALDMARPDAAKRIVDFIYA